jgi:hypothetical protein
MLRLQGIAGFDDGFFARGQLRFQGGANAGRVGLVKVLLVWALLAQLLLLLLLLPLVPQEAWVASRR